MAPRAIGDLWARHHRLECRFGRGYRPIGARLFPVPSRSTVIHFSRQSPETRPLQLHLTLKQRAMQVLLVDEGVGCCILAGFISNRSTQLKCAAFATGTSIMVQFACSLDCNLCTVSTLESTSKGILPAVIGWPRAVLASEPDFRDDTVTDSEAWRHSVGSITTDGSPATLALGPDGDQHQQVRDDDRVHDPAHAVEEVHEAHGEGYRGGGLRCHHIPDRGLRRDIGTDSCVDGNGAESGVGY
ncbi:hypothetical protein ON010_g14789 [Phytophthora cinnamomi]|nr:hypothetical protein ON010_g14789 [Phytophthora cinnamomi]